MSLTTDQKGNIAEHAVLFEATKLGIDVYRPAGEGGRYDTLFANSASGLCASSASGRLDTAA